MITWRRTANAAIASSQVEATAGNGFAGDRLLRVHAGVCSDVGPVRPLNEDRAGTWQDLTPPPPVAEAGYLFAVADGVGGRDKGEVASTLAIRTLFASYYAADTHDPGHALTQAYEQANAAVYVRGRAQGADRAMASTLVAGVIHGSILTVANVGDSRAYLVRGGSAARQITRDHSLVAEAVQAGTMTAVEAARSSQRNVITRALGAAPTVAVDIFTMVIQPDDVIVLCSDGLYGVVQATQIGHIARDVPPEQAAVDLVMVAVTHGTRDNISAVVVTVAQETALSLR